MQCNDNINIGKKMILKDNDIEKQVKKDISKTRKSIERDISQIPKREEKRIKGMMDKNGKAPQLEFIHKKNLSIHMNRLLRIKIMIKG